MKRVAVVQARMGSTRLPGKVLLDLAGRPVLVQLLRRLKACRSLDELVVATSTAPDDDRIADVARLEGVHAFRGSETDVLDRFVLAARETQADVIVRVTGDCPMIDPGVVDRIVDTLVADAANLDYASNVLHRTYPRGLDAEALFIDTLLRVNRLAKTDAEREHVTITIRSERPELFRTASVEQLRDDSDLRWTVDAEQDLELIRTLYRDLDLADRVTSYQTVVAYVRDHPELARINSAIATWTP